MGASPPLGRGIARECQAMMEEIDPIAGADPVESVDPFEGVDPVEDASSTMVRDALVVARLATFDPFEYDRCREDEARKLGIRAQTLDAQVRAARGAVRREAPKPLFPVRGGRWTCR
jgi:hypothetical protein